MNIADHLKRHAEQIPKRTALIADRQVSFAELWQASTDKLQRWHPAPGERAIIMIPMGVDLYATLIAIWRTGAVAVFIDPWMKRKQISAFADFAEASLYAGQGKAALLRWLTAGLRRIPAASPRATAPAADLIHPVAPEDTALITFTSGSSGTPKGANRTHGLLQAQHEALTHAFPYEDTDVDMTMFPVFALNNLATGIPTVVPDMDFRRVADLDARRICQQMEQHGVTTCTASPPFFDHLAALSKPPRLRRFLVGGAPVTNAQLKRWRTAFPETEIVVVYGSTEAEPTAHLSLEERLELQGPGFCCGKPVLDAKLIAIQQDGAATLTDPPPGDYGELVVSGEHVCRDYFRNPTATAENKIYQDERCWHRMGDTGYFDDAGRFWLTGRVHSSIPHEGGFAQPQLIEQAARGDDPHIARIAALRHQGQVCVVVQSELALDTTAIQQRCVDAGQPCDRVLLTRKPLPVDPRHNSKIDYPALENMLDAL